MLFKDFEKKYLQPSEDWDFSKFGIVCKKCKSSDVEFAGKMETENGYYGEVSFEHKIIIKCHKCGNAFGMKFMESESSDYCPDCD